MLKLLGLLILCITFVHCQDDDGDGSGSGDYPDPDGSGGGNDDCKCLYNKIKHVPFKCMFSSDFWCYVSPYSSCKDKKLAARDPDLYFSFEACDGKIKTEPFPLPDGGEILRKRGKAKQREKAKERENQKG